MKDNYITLNELKRQRKIIDNQIKEMEANKSAEVYAGKCYKDKYNGDYFMVFDIDTEHNASYIKVNFNEDVWNMLHDDYDDLITFIGDEDTVEITKEEFNNELDKVIEAIKQYKL